MYLEAWYQVVVPSVTAVVQCVFLWSFASKAFTKSGLSPTTGGGPAAKIYRSPSAVLVPGASGMNCQMVVVLSLRNILSKSFSQVYNGLLITAEAALAASG
ncbi:hypothetical protein D3C86_1761660 [compost metagenome]